jgi:hypothetical protein
LEPYENAKNIDDVMNNQVDSKHISDGSIYTTNVHVHEVKNIVEESKNTVGISKNMKVKSNNMKDDSKKNTEGVEMVYISNDTETKPLIPMTCSLA